MEDGMMRSMHGLLLPIAVAAALALAVPSVAQTVSGFKVEGNDSVSRDRILLTFGVRVGETLSAEGVREGVRRLYGLGSFSDIRVLAEPVGEGEELELVIVVEERPRISAVEIHGNDKIGESDIESVLRIARGSPFDSSSLEDSRAAVLSLYESKGFPYAEVSAAVEEAPDNAVRVILSIDEKTRVTVRRIEFEGNEAFEDSDLKKVMETKEDRWWRTDAFLDATVLAEDLARVVEL